MFSTLRSKIRYDAAPTEAQMKLAIAQTLGQSYAYNAPVIVLDFEVDDDGEITGRFRDAARPRVFSFEIDEASVAYKPFSPNRMDSDSDIKQWEEFSKGYSYRVDAKAKGKPRAGKPQCNPAVSMPCGKACISLKKQCRSEPVDAKAKEDLGRVNAAGKAYKEAKVKEETKKELVPEPAKPQQPSITENPSPPSLPNSKKPTTAALQRISTSAVDIESIESDTKKSDFSAQQIEDLADSIVELRGLVNPIIVAQSGAGKFKVLKGDLEYHAAVRALEKDDYMEMINVFIASPETQSALLKQAKLLSR